MSYFMPCNAGWIPSVSAGISTETALLEGTPGLTPDDVYLPTLPPVDEEVQNFFEAASINSAGEKSIPSEYI